MKNPELETLLKSREELLNKNPKLRILQQEIDEILNKVPESQRLEVISIMLAGKMEELIKSLNELHRLVDQIK